MTSFCFGSTTNWRNPGANCLLEARSGTASHTSANHTVSLTYRGADTRRRLLRVESANSISEPAAVRSALTWLGHQSLSARCRLRHCDCDDEQRLCRLRHCDCDDEQRLLWPSLWSFST